MPVPDETPTDPITDHIISMFWVAHRARRYLAGAGGAVALPLSAIEINQVLNAYGSPLTRLELDACLSALDSEYLSAI